MHGIIVRFNPYILHELNPPSASNGIAVKISLEFHIAVVVSVSTPSMKHRWSGVAATVTNDNMCMPAVKADKMCKKNWNPWYRPNSPKIGEKRNEGKKLLVMKANVLTYVQIIQQFYWSQLFILHSIDCNWSSYPSMMINRLEN